MGACACALVIGAATPNSVQAQSKIPITISGGLSVDQRSAPDPSDAQDLASATAIGGRVDVTFWLRQRLGLDASVAWHAGETFTFHYRYLFGPADYRITESDMPLTAAIRGSIACSTRVCVDLLAGGGFNVHHISMVKVADCGLGDCVPVSGTDQEPDRFEPLFLAGAELRLQLSSRIAISPGVRLLFIHRQDDLTSLSFRGPVNAGGEVLSFGLTVSWNAKR